MRLKKAKFIFPILSMMAMAVLLVFFGMSQVKAIDIFDSWMQIGAQISMQIGMLSKSSNFC